MRIPPRGGGGKLLDVGCGKGALLTEIKEHYPHLTIQGIDWVIQTEDLPVICGSMYELPFENDSFDTVLCTHTLEHLREPKKAINELLRVAKDRLIIVLPKQREYLYTADLHVNFIPYLYNLKIFIGIQDLDSKIMPYCKYMELKGDFLCDIQIK